MEMNEEITTHKSMRVEIPPEIPEVVSPPGQSGLARQGSITKSNCLCSPTTHPGSFRCRLHRVGPALQRTKSVDSKPNPSTHGGSTVKAQ
ncbi:Notch 3 intracellular domain like [Actinidia chinensis var. chinensis]|uniref:Notch 3 intracellular domain like n=1 Tax=Actinidia chinensis var. chinensis TaxID=1590841 RepID=A0A2R6QR61_ACTCC|nr:Notch 3 intracellular domain like [Actinidia chinensis var. chinensis]